MAGGLAGLGGGIADYANSPTGGNMLQALGMSLMSSPGRAPLKNFGQFYGGLQKQQMTQDALDQERSDALASRAAMAQALIASGVPEDEAKTLAINPAAAKVRLDQISSERASKADAQFLSGFGALGGAPDGSTGVSSVPVQADAPIAQTDLPPAQMPQEYGGANVFSEPGAAQANYRQFTPGAGTVDSSQLEPAMAPGPGAEIPMSDVSTGKQNKTIDWLKQNDPEAAALVDQGFSPSDALAIAVERQKMRPQGHGGSAQNAKPTPAGLPAQAQQGAVMRGADGQNYQYIQLTGGTDGVGEWGWNRVNTGGPQGQEQAPAQAPAQVQAQVQTGQQPATNLDELYRKRDIIARKLAGAPSKEAFDRGKMYLDIYDEQIKRAEGAKGSTYDQRAAAARQYGLDPNSDEFRNFILSGKLPDPPNARDQFGLNPIYGKDKDGNLIVMQPSKSGGLVTAELPEGVTLQPGTGKIDLGTEWGITDRSGMIIQRIPKSLAEAEAQKAEGKSRGEASFDLPRVEQNAEQTLGILERMKTHPGREGSTGFVQGILPSRTSEQVDFQSLVDQTQGQSFLQAFQMLKGAGQITEIEGQKATVAISRLGNQRLSDADYLKAITDLEDVIKAGLARAKKQAGQGASPSPDRTDAGTDYKSKYGLD